MRGFAALLGDFLLDYVPRRRGLSENTAAKYKDAYLCHAALMAAADGLIRIREEESNG